MSDQQQAPLHKWEIGLRLAHAGGHLVARMVEVLIRGKWLPWLREHREPATPLGTHSNAALS